MVGVNSWADFFGPVASKPFYAPSYLSAIQPVTNKNRTRLQFTINGVAYRTHTVESSLVQTGGTCGSSEIGFQYVDTVFFPKWDSGQTMTVTFCFGSITGTGLNPGDDFYQASVDQVGVVDTVAIDPAHSSVHVT